MNIDQLSGRELDEAVAVLDGWERVVRDGRTAWHRSPVPFLMSEPTQYSSNLCAAMLLLVKCCLVRINIGGTHITVSRMDNEAEPRILASGPKDQAATILCRAWLKLKERA
jgi:hypothetical protein